jgi:RHS repeat-associated protein
MQFVSRAPRSIPKNVFSWMIVLVVLGLSAPFAYNLRLPGQVFDGQAGLHDNGYRAFDPAIGGYIESDPMGLAAGVNTCAYVSGDPTNLIDPTGLIKIPGIPDSDGETSVHANPGPEATVPGSQMEHDPPHIHLGSNDGPRVLTKDFTPYSAKDAARMTRKQVKFCKSLSDEAKTLIRLRQSQVFKYGKVLSALMAAPIALDSATAACSQDPFFCIDNMSEILDSYAIDHGIPLNHQPETTDPNP